MQTNNLVSFIKNRKNLRIALEILLLLIICYFPLCYRIDYQAIRQWDEARNAVHVVEMLKSHNYLVRSFEGSPETWETKPPLLTWLQVLSTKIFGLNELAIRFPVILASFLTVILLVFNFFRYFNNRFIGYLAALVLITSQGYIDRHIARTGDHDALLIFFLTAVILLFYQYLTKDQKKPFIIICIGILMVLAVYTKSIAAFFIVPGLLMSTILFKGTRKLFSDKWFYIAAGSFILFVAGYYILREYKQPDYLKAVWHEELLPRYSNTEGKFDSGTFWYYLKNLYGTRYTYWLLFLGCAMLFSFMKTPFQKFNLYIILNTCVLFLVLSMGSKGLWYDGPLYPLFAIIIGLFLYTLFEKISKKIAVRHFTVKTLIVVVLAGLFIYPYIMIIKKISRTEEFYWDREYYSMSYKLRDHAYLKQIPDPLKVVFEGYNAHLLFYVESENYREKKDRLILRSTSAIQVGDAVMLSQVQVMDSIKQKFSFEMIDSGDPVKVIRITEQLTSKNESIP